MVKIEIRYHKRFLTNERIMRRIKMEHLISMITRRCHGKNHRCNGGWAYIKHSNCAYVDELSNYNYCCKDCHEEIDNIYQEWRDEYNSGRL